MTDFNNVKVLLSTIRTDLLGRTNVVATGIGYKETAGKKTSDLCIVCSVAEKFTAFDVGVSDLIPKQVGGIPIDVRQSGVIRALKSHKSGNTTSTVKGNVSRLRPAKGGVSIGHFAITAGTLGCIVKKNGQIYILSNNHVLANRNDATIGDAVLQPGPADGGVSTSDQLAILSEFIPIHYLHRNSQIPRCKSSPLNEISDLKDNHLHQPVTSDEYENLVDAALAKPINAQDVSEDIIDIGRIKGVGEASLGMSVVKSGRTTGLTEGVIEQVDVTVDVEYGGGNVARFNDQLIAGPMSQGGDSGSVVLNNKRQMIGLLFAGSDSTTLINRVQNVFLELDVSL